MTSAERIYTLIADIAEVSTCRSRAEWIGLFERTQATNAPGILFADAKLIGLLVEQRQSEFIFVKPGQEVGSYE